MAHPVKLLLQFFICIIYAELLKAVPLKGLESAQKEREREICQSLVTSQKKILTIHYS